MLIFYFNHIKIFGLFSYCSMSLLNVITKKSINGRTPKQPTTFVIDQNRILLLLLT